MDFQVEHAYDCSPEELHAVLTDAGFVAAKFRALGFRDVEVLQAEPAAVRTRRSLEVDLPGFAAKVLGNRQSIEQDENWAAIGDAVHGTFRGRSLGTPVSLTGTMTIEPHGSGSVLAIRGRADAKIPFVGGKIAALVAAQTKKSLDREYDFTRVWLKEQV